MKTILSLLIFIFSYCAAFSQDSSSCNVMMENIKGKYTGECKKGKAEGIGKAFGTDTYEGNFKNGYPDGEGKYIWKNGDFFQGNFKKGLREGKGIFTAKRRDSTENVTTGFWKKDLYIGEYEKPYKIISYSVEISKLTVDADVDKNKSTIEIALENTTSNNLSIATGLSEHMKITDIRISKGTFNIRNDISQYKKEVTTLKEVTFPFRSVFYFGSYSVEVEFFVPGAYSVFVYVNK